MAVPDREPPLVAEGRRAGRPVPRVRALRQAHRARGWPADRPGLHTVGLTHRDASILGETSNMALTCGNLRADARTRTANRPITSRVNPCRRGSLRSVLPPLTWPFPVPGFAEVRRD